MKKNDRNLFYSDYQAGGFMNPQMGMNQGYMPQMQQVPQMQQMPQNMLPSGYMLNNNYMSYGPMASPNAVPEQYQNTFDNSNSMDSRLNKLERQVRKLEARVSKLETNTDTVTDSTDNLYII